MPLADFADPEHYNHIKIKSSEYNSLASEDQNTFVFTSKPARIRSAMVPVHILEKEDNKKLDFVKLPMPRTFSEIDYEYKKRVAGGCISVGDMLNGYKNNALNEKYLQCIEREFPAIIKRITIGKSRQRRKIIALRISFLDALDQPKNENMPVIPLPVGERDNILINCGIHANEPIAIEHCYDILVRVLAHPENYPHLSRVNLWVIPVVNPDGLHNFWFKDLHAGRKNGYYSPGVRQVRHRGVDLNRNFPFKWNSEIKDASSGLPGHHYYRGRTAASEPETRAMINLFEKERFIMSYSYHCYANSLLVPYSIEGTENPKPHTAGILAEELVKGVVSYREEKPFLIKKNLYAVDGTDMDFYYHQFGTLAYIPESSHRLQNYNDVDKILTGLRPLWENLLSVYDESLKIKIKVIDASGNPLAAEIVTEGVEYLEEEKRSSSQRGLYTMIVLNKKPVKVRLSKTGYLNKEVTLVPHNTMHREMIVMQKSQPQK